MAEWFTKLENSVDASIPYLVLLLVGVVALELAAPDVAHTPLVQAVDALVIAVFVVDLLLKYARHEEVEHFIKKYWIDIIAVFPFFLFFRSLSGILAFLKLEHGVFAGVQTSLHALAGISRGGAGAARATYAARLVRVVPRIPRLLKIVPYLRRHKAYCFRRARAERRV